MQPNRNSLKIKLFADGADFQGMIEMAKQDHISGLTTNPTLMRKAGITNYMTFAKQVLREIKDKPISFEVFSDDLEEMKLQALKIASWQDNVYVKIPITNTKKESTGEVVKFLSNNGVKVNVTALMTLDQVQDTLENLNPNTPSYISVFAGRIADTGVNPMPLMRQCVKTMLTNSTSELIWASPRELLNVFQADEVGCHIITATNDILNKLKIVGKDLEEFSLDTVKMFYTDATAAGYSIS
jgi:transaldolase